MKKKAHTKKVRVKIDMVVEYEGEFRSLPNLPKIQQLQDALGKVFDQHNKAAEGEKAVAILPGAHFGFSLDWRKS